MGEVLTSSFSAPNQKLNVISPIPAPVRSPHLAVRPRAAERRLSRAPIWTSPAPCSGQGNADQERERAPRVLLAIANARV